MATRGILYSATGENYITEALSSAKSSLRFNKIPHCIFCDSVPQYSVDGVQFVRFEFCGDAFIDKINAIAQTPFDETIFLATDTTSSLPLSRAACRQGKDRSWTQHELRQGGGADQCRHRGAHHRTFAADLDW